jgi:hypothetical protein
VSHKPNKLLLEGHDDLFSVAGLMRHFVNWPDNKDDVPVWIQVGKGVSIILEKDYISTSIKDPSTTVLGVMLDADLDASSRYDSFRNLCKEYFPRMPTQLPATGLIDNNDDGKAVLINKHSNLGRNLA